MSIRIPCPHCGERDLEEFRYGGELRSRPQPGAAAAEWTNYNFLRKNTLGVGTEWWYHKLGCGTWFKINRDTRTNAITPAPK